MAFLILNGPAVQKICSRQIAVAALRSFAGLPPKKPQTVRLQLLPCSPLAGPAATKISSTQSAVAILQLSYWVCQQKSWKLRLQLLSCSPLLGLPPKDLKKRQIAVATVAFLILNGPAVQKISSSQVQLPCSFFAWACCLKNLKYADCSCSAAFLLKRKIWSRSVQAKNFEIDAIHNQIRANQHCLWQ